MALTAVIGTGTWGAAAAALAVRTGKAPVVLLGRDRERVAVLAASRRHAQMPDQPLPADLAISADPGVVAAADLVLWAVPTQFTRDQARRLRPHLAPDAVVVSLAKGLEQGSLLRVSEVLAAELGPRAYGAISGPSHAIEVMAGLPVVLAMAGDEACCALASARLHSSRCRLYTTSDLAGVELGGALKNVIAVAAGICDGLRLGDNTKAAVITRGLAEMRRLGRALGAQDGTFAGMAGIGDLLATCYSPHGRNRALGVAVAQGEGAAEHLARRSTVAEGAWTCRAAVELAARVHIELPIASQVASVLWAATPVRTAMESLLSRAPKEENA